MRVSVAAGAGVPHEEIALALGITRAALETRFEFELSVGAYRRRMEALEAMFAAARKGNVVAQKAYLAARPQLAAPPLPAERAARDAGKKARAQAAGLDAHVGTDWETLLAPASTKQ